MEGLPQAGDAFGRYDIVRRLGERDGAVTYRAIQRDLQREVILTLLARDTGSTQEHRTAFLARARAMAHAESGVEVLDAGEIDGMAFFVTQPVPHEKPDDEPEEAPDTATEIEIGGLDQTVIAPFEAASTPDVMEAPAEEVDLSEAEVEVAAPTPPTSVRPRGRRVRILVGAAVALALAAATGVAIRQSLTLNDDELALAKQMGVSLQAVNPWTSEEAARCASEGLVKERGLDAVVASSDLVDSEFQAFARTPNGAGLAETWFTELLACDPAARDSMAGAASATASQPEQCYRDEPEADLAHAFAAVLLDGAQDDRSDATSARLVECLGLVSNVTDVANGNHRATLSVEVASAPLVPPASGMKIKGKIYSPTESLRVPFSRLGAQSLTVVTLFDGVSGPGATVHGVSPFGAPAAPRLAAVVPEERSVLFRLARPRLHGGKFRSFEWRRSTGKWRSSGKEVRVATNEGGEEACVYIRATAGTREDSASSPARRFCGRAAPRTVVLRDNGACDGQGDDSANCRNLDVVVTGFRSGQEYAITTLANGDSTTCVASDGSESPCFDTVTAGANGRGESASGVDWSGAALLTVIVDGISASRRIY